MLNIENNALLKCKVTGNIANDVGVLKKIFHYPENSDLILRNTCCGSTGITLAFIDGMVRLPAIEDFTIKALIQREDDKSESDMLKYLLDNALQVAHAEIEQDFTKLTEGIMSGATLVFCENVSSVIVLDTRGYESRKVSQPTNESVVRGSQEGYVENLRTNITLIRRYCQTPDLVTEMVTVGSQSPLRVAITYIAGITDENALNEARKRIKSIDAPVVHGLGQLQQYIEDDPWALVPQMLLTERPDRTAAALADGQFAIFADCSPYALIAPCNIFTLMQSSDDAFSRWQYGTYMRVIRFIGLILALLLPGIYVALISYHTQLIPLELLSSIAETRVNVPFPVLVEVMIMELAFFMINEANLRIPSQVGMSISIIGGLVLGQAAVQASIISPILIIVIALSGLGCYCMPNYGMTIALIIYRLFIEISAAFLGLFGVTLSVFMIFCQLASIQSFGCSFMAPVAPKKPHNPDIILRFPIFMQRKPQYYSRKSSTFIRKQEHIK